MSDTNNTQQTPSQKPETIVITPQVKPKRSRRGWLIGGAVAVIGLAGFGAVQAFSQPFGGHRFGGHHMHAHFDPARMGPRIDFGLDIILGRVGANEEQKRKFSELVKANLKDLPALRQQAMESRTKIIELLKAEKIDRVELERIRAQQIAAVDQATRRLTQAVSEAAETLTPKQRQELISLWERRPGRP